MEQKKEQRQRNILDILKGQGNLTIKDFSRVMTDCSEKTIQRELIELVNKGVVRKEGKKVEQVFPGLGYLTLCQKKHSI